jgi:hypothetical protein
MTTPTESIEPVRYGPYTEEELKEKGFVLMNYPYVPVPTNSSEKRTKCFFRIRGVSYDSTND